MVDFLEKTKEWKEYLETDCDNIKLLGEAMTQAFLNIDVAIREHQNKNEKDTSGCTSVTAIITKTHIICANAGDSRCVMGSAGVAIPLSDDHKPYNQEEKARIENAGGHVQYDRVDGDLAVSRALGDFQWKQRTDLKPDQQRVSSF